MQARPTATTETITETTTTTMQDIAGTTTGGRSVTTPAKEILT